MKNHEKAHETITCDQCNHISNGVSEFITHLLKYHESEYMKHKCDQCHIIAMNKTELKNHIATTHNGISLHDLFTNQNDVKCMISDLKSQLGSSFSTISDDLKKLKGKYQP